MLDIKNLSVALSGKRLLQDVSLTVAPGEIVALIGPNGAGKSTLLKAVSGDLSAQSGSVSLFGAARGTWKPRALAQRMAFMRQSSNERFGFTTFELAALGLAPHGLSPNKPVHRETVMRALATVGLKGFENRLVPSLSGGERQRVFLARALVQICAQSNADISKLLLLDEPTSALDPAQQGVALTAVKKLCRDNISALVVLHDLTLASLFADRVIILKDAQIVASGGVEEIMSHTTLSTSFDCCLEVDQRSRDQARVVSLGNV